MIFYKTAKEIAEMRRGGDILARVLEEVIAAVKPGVKTTELDALAHERIVEAGCQPAFLGYEGSVGETPFPNALCVSLNSEVVHGVASRNITLREGDIVGLDIGLRYPGANRELILDMA